MGNGAGKSNAGMPLSPRAEFADKCAAKTDAAIVIDAPALIDLGHGTVRYRREDGADEDAIKPTLDSSSSTASQRRRMLGNKKGYFYHAKLSDYSENAQIDPEENFKYKYVSRGAPKTRGKRLYYVYGIGVNSVDAAKNVRKTEKPQGKGYNWPSTYRERDHLYYQLSFLEEMAGEGDDDEDEDEISEDVDDQQPGSCMKFRMRDIDSVEKLKKRAAIRLLVPPTHIHVIYEGSQDLSNEDIIGHLKSGEDGEVFKRFTIELTPC